MDLLDELRTRLICGDGAIGTLLLESGVPPERCFEELDPPKTLAREKFFAGAQALVKAGCDAITVADNSLAILRVRNLAMGAMLMERFGITSLLHLSCRDRNVLGLQSELLGTAGWACGMCCH